MHHAVLSMKVYLDNNVVSSISRDDNKAQSAAITRLLEAHEQRKVEVVTSEITLEEIRKCPPVYRPPLWSVRSDSLRKCQLFNGRS
jgi:hypothetical protein